MNHRSRLPEKLCSGPGVHGKAGLVYRIFNVCFVVKEKVRPVEADVVESAVGADNSLKLRRQLLVDITSEAIVSVSRRHIKSILRQVR